VTAEVAPHHLTLDHTAVETMDAAYKMYPPLRRPEDVEAVRTALAEGIIDAVATDHAPHAAHEKDVPFEHAPRGIIGLETAAALVSPLLEPRVLYERMSVAPAEIAGLDRHGHWIEKGRPANITVFDPAATWRVDGFRSRSENSPYLGRELTGMVRYTIHDGHVTHKP
jgi:dihydroorotase